MSKEIYLWGLLAILLFSILFIYFPQDICLDSKDISGDSYTQIIEQGPKNKKVIALTFDDGPHPKFTLQILDLLKKYDIRATFFVLGKYAELYPDIIRRELTEGHEIGNHSYSHIDVKRASAEIIREEFGKTQETIYSISNVKPKLIRPPFGFCNSKIINVAEETDCTIILWSRNHDSKDWSNPGAEIITETVISKTENGDILLLHDCVYEEKSDTVEALKTILPTLKDRGYEFITISELIEMIME